MISQRLEIQMENTIKFGDSIPVDLEPGVCHDEFWKEAPEDVLSEIFIRLPDCRTAVRCSTVCGLWHSLILRNPQFTPRFVYQHHQHQDRYPLPYAIIFLKAAEINRHFQPICQLVSNEWVFLHGKLSDNYLDFLPSPTVIIRASCNDLLLVSHAGSHAINEYHFICNPITKQFVQLPAIPSPSGATGYALVCMPSAGPTTNSQCKVVEIFPPGSPLPEDDPNGSVQFNVTIFCSESREWERRRLHYPRTTAPSRISPLDIVACNGILYWLEDERLSNMVIYLDLSKEQCGAIAFPADDIYYEPHRIGTVRGPGRELELRLILAKPIRMQGHILLRVWRLNNHNNKWVLVHNKRMESPNKCSREEQRFVTHFVHPTNGDLVFVVWGQNMFEYDLINATYKMTGEFRQTVRYGDILMPFSMVHSYGASKLHNTDLQVSGAE